MSWGDWILMIFAAAFFGVVLFALVAFVIRIFREAEPNKRKRSRGD